MQVAVGDAAATARPNDRPLRAGTCWALTLVATVVSMWALDATATATGILLVASPVFDGAPLGLLLGFLVFTYLLWAAGLRVNLNANWHLLEETGTSTNALSKVCFELARRRSNSQSTVRAASSAGYVITEIAKEIPYYAGAFGAALLIDSVDSNDVLTFLSGTNLGAAAYEYGLGRLTRTFLAGRWLRSDHGSSST